MASLRERLNIIVFGTDTKAGKRFDVWLLVLILASTIVVMLDSVSHIRSYAKGYFSIAEWVFTGIFTIELLLRIWISPRPFKYLFSFYGLVDLFSVLPQYLSLFIPGSHNLIIVRTIRLLRVFRILKMVHLSSEAQSLLDSIERSKNKIIVFLGAAVSLASILGTLMYVVEGPEHGFKSIPLSIYWAVVTMTTVGYGDIAPQTVLGKFIATAIMLIGYGVLAVPTGLISAEIVKGSNNQSKHQCPACGWDRHEAGAQFCNQCGHSLEEEKSRKTE